VASIKIEGGGGGLSVQTRRTEKTRSKGATSDKIKSGEGAASKEESNGRRPGGKRVIQRVDTQREALTHQKEIYCWGRVKTAEEGFGMTRNGHV